FPLYQGPSAFELHRRRALRVSVARTILTSPNMTELAMSRKKIWLFRALAVCLGILLSEAILYLACLCSPRIHYFLSPPWNQALMPDPELGHRMSPFYPGNDSWGFRNSKVPDHCDVLAIGDSLTYGLAATPDKTWPRQLEVITGKSV